MLAGAGFPDENIAVLELLAGRRAAAPSLPVAAFRKDAEIIRCADNAAVLVSGFLQPLFAGAVTPGAAGACRKIMADILAEMGLPPVCRCNYAAALELGQIMIIVRGPVAQVDRAADLLATGKEIEVAVYQRELLSGPHLEAATNGERIFEEHA